MAGGEGDDKLIFADRHIFVYGHDAQGIRAETGAHGSVGEQDRSAQAVGDNCRDGGCNMVSLGTVYMSRHGRLDRFKSGGYNGALGGSDITGSQDRMLATEL